ncbi:MAG: AbrB/MazE/SpoVT family DNA-binding domain-containing protein [Candidatus Hodarchaeota archaeon]
MSVILELDERGRITIPKEWRENLQLKRTVAIQSKHGILLIPLSNDPLNVLRGAFTTEKSVKELKQQASKLLEQEN